MLATLLGQVAADPELWADFEALCSFGGRVAGTKEEAKARDWASARLGGISAGLVRRDPITFSGWTCHRSEVTDVDSGRVLAAIPLLGTASTPPGGLELEVLDVGRGLPEQIVAQGDAVRGRALLVRHDYGFGTGSVHRRQKLMCATDAGAAAFLIAKAIPGIGPVSGSSGRNGGTGIPALGLSSEAAATIAAPRRSACIKIIVEGQDTPATTEVLVLDLPGSGPGYVVVSAHIDGHPLGESAIDNATGVVAAMALARAAAPIMSQFSRGLRICLFGAEEWALVGSRTWMDSLSPEARSEMLFNLNLDSIAGTPRLTALTSGFINLPAFIREATASVGTLLPSIEPLMANSDHANFARHGIPAARLVAGFNEPDSVQLYLLTSSDTRHLVAPAELKGATIIAAAILYHALSVSSETMAKLRER